MEDYIYRRYQRAKQLINEELNHCKKYRIAKNIDFQQIRERALKPTETRSFPKHLKSEIAAILDFCYQREVLNNFLYPVLYEGKLYCKWKFMPEGCKEMLRKATTEESSKHRPYPVFTWHFTEGMDKYK